MELFNISLKNENLDILINRILNGDIRVEKFLSFLRKNQNFFEENVAGEIEKSTLIKILEKGNKNREYGKLLVNLIDIIDEKVIDDVVFEKIIFFSNKEIRESLIVSLVHKKLTEQQMLYLCNYGRYFECYFELAILYYVSKDYSLEKLEAFIEEFSKCKFSYMLEELLNELLEYHQASHWLKKEYIEKYRSKM